VNTQTWIEYYMLKAADMRPAGNLRVSVWREGLSSIDRVYADGCVGCTTRPLNLALVTRTEARSADEFNCHILHLKAEQPKVARGLPCKGRFFFSERNIIDDPKIGFYSAKPWVHSSFDGKRFQCWNTHGARIPERDHIIPAALAMQCFFEYAWSVRFIFESRAPSIVLHVDKEMLSEMLELRDIPPGKKKRDAVIHSVSRHTRSSGVTIDPHYRGHTDHIFEGCKMEVTPPINDVVNATGSKARELVAAMEGGSA